MKENDKEAEKNEGQQQGQAAPLSCRAEASDRGLTQTEWVLLMLQNTSQVNGGPVAEL